MTLFVRDEWPPAAVTRDVDERLRAEVEHEMDVVDVTPVPVQAGPLSGDEDVGRAAGLVSPENAVDDDALTEGHEARAVDRQLRVKIRDIVAVVDGHCVHEVGHFQAAICVTFPVADRVGVAKAVDQYDVSGPGATPGRLVRHRIDPVGRVVPETPIRPGPEQPRRRRTVF